MKEFGTGETTNVPGLDLILGGGLPQRGMVVVVGAPGTGKTVLVQQIAFHTATGGRPALYFSGFSESNERLIEHTRVFEFFDEGLLAEKIQLLSLGTAIEEGADAVLDVIVQSVRRRRAALVIIDGFLGLRALLRDEDEGGRFLHRLSAQIAVLGALLIIVMEGEPGDRTLTADLAASDVVLGLFRERGCTGHTRNLEVLKRRGAAPLLGLHSFIIDQRGVVCYPQFEMTLTPGETPFDPAARAPFDLPALDTILGGGLTQQTMTMVAGDPGSGKTILGLQFLAAGAARGEPGVLLGFHESSEQLLAKATQHGIDLGAAVRDGTVVLQTQPPVDLEPNIVAHELHKTLAKRQAKRLVVDSVDELESAVASERLPEYGAALVTSLRRRGISALITHEIDRRGPTEGLSNAPLSVLAENLLLLRQITREGRRRGSLAVVKMRFSDHDRTIREYTIGERGLTVLQPWDSQEHSVGDQAMPRGSGRHGSTTRQDRPGS
jgi:circadian clock protein KaiC